MSIIQRRGEAPSRWETESHTHTPSSLRPSSSSPHLDNISAKPTQHDILGSPTPPTDQAACLTGWGKRRERAEAAVSCCPWSRGQCWEQKEKQASHLVSFMDRSLISSQRTAANTCSVGKQASVGILVRDWPQQIGKLKSSEGTFSSSPTVSYKWGGGAVLSPYKFPHPGEGGHDGSFLF